MKQNRSVPEPEAAHATDCVSFDNEDLWRAFVATHKKLATIERIEQLITDLKAVEAARSEHYTKELATIEHIERLVAELNTAIAARSDRYVREGHRRG